MTIIHHIDTKKSNRRDIGFLYSASVDVQFLALAFLSAFSLKLHCPKSDISLFTDFHWPELENSTIINRVFFANNNSNYSNNWVNGKTMKFVTIQNSPYSCSLYIDADTRIYRDEVSSFPNYLRNSDIAMCRFGLQDSFCARMLQTPVFNAGIIAFSDAIKVTQLWEEWETRSRLQHSLLDAPLKELPEVFRSIHDSKSRRHLLKMDQISLHEMLSTRPIPYSVDITTMPSEWNSRTSKPSTIPNLIIQHSRSLKSKLRTDLMKRYKDLLECGSPVDAEIVSRIIDLLPSYSPGFTAEEK